MKPSIFEVILSNSKYFKPFYSKKEKREKYKEDKCFDSDYWHCVETSVPQFHCPLSVIEDYFGEEFDFDKHIKPLIDGGKIWCRKFQNCFPHSKELELRHRRVHSTCKDYDTGICYFQFYLGDSDPNSGYKWGSGW